MDDTRRQFPKAYHDHARLIPQCIDQAAEQKLQQPYALIPRSDEDISQGFEPVSYATFARAIDRASWWLDEHLSGPEGAVFTYWGPEDLRWNVLFVAAIKSGRVMLHSSPWANLTGLLNLYKHCQCTGFLVDALPSADSDLAKLCQLDPQIKPIAIPTVHAWLRDDVGEEESRHYLYTKSWSEAADDPIAIFHTSGTTGTPKPVVYTNRRVSIWDALREAHKEDSDIFIPITKGNMVHSRFNAPHIGGPTMSLFWPVFFSQTIIYGPAKQPLTAAISDAIMRLSGANSGAFAQSQLREAMSTPDQLATLRQLKSITVAGSLMSPREAAIISDNGGPLIQNLYASTESYPLVQRQVPKELPDHIALHPYSGYSFRPYCQASDAQALYELVIVRNDAFKLFQPSFGQDPHQTSLHVGDLFSKHPAKPDLWCFRGRVDDMLVLSNSQNVFVADMEATIASHPDVRGALVGGHGHNRPVLLVQPRVMTSNDSSAGVEVRNHKAPNGKAIDDKAFLSHIWPSIEEANTLCTANARIDLDRVIVARQPLVYTKKGTVQRLATLDLFQEEIRVLYP